MTTHIPFLVRPAQLPDLAQFLALYQQFVPEDPILPSDIAEARFNEILSHPGMTLFGGFVGDQLVATCTLIIIPNMTRVGAPYALIENVVTDQNHRQKGYGRKVLDAAVAKAFDAQCYKVMLLTGTHNPGTLKFYGNCGFSQSKTGFERRSPNVPPRLGNRANPA